MTHEHSFHRLLADPAADAGHLGHPPRVGFFTNTPSASAARPARWRARNGTTWPRTA